MPGLMGRASMIVKAKFSKLLDRSENPNETLDYSYEEQLRSSGDPHFDPPVLEELKTKQKKRGRTKRKGR